MLNIKKTLVKILDFIGTVPEVRHGGISIGSITANTYVDVDVTFDSAMSGVPDVVCSMVSTSTSATMGSITVSAINPTATGFTCRAFNNTSANRSPAIKYVAVYGGGTQ